MKNISTIFSLILLWICSNPSSIAGEGTSVPTPPSALDTRHPTLIKTGETIAFLGDSITAGGAGYGGYCRLVVHGLKTKGIRVKAIYAGVPGNKSSDMLLRLDGILKQKPDHLFLSVGVNDVWHTDETAKIGVFKPSPGMGVELEHFKIYVPQILNRCKAAGTDVIMSTFTQITEAPEHRLNKKAKAYNEFLRGLAKERNLPIALLNGAAWAKITELKTEAGDGNRNYISSDGIHPTPIGHRTMALGVLRAMGFTDSELTKVENEWNSARQIMLIGDRQINSGNRPGGWCTMFLDCLNSGREMVTGRTVASWEETTAELIASAELSINDRTRYILLMPPLSDVKAKIPLEVFENAVKWLVELAGTKNSELVISTYPIVGRDLKSDINVSAERYNDVLRKVCIQSGVPLADIADSSKAYMKANPGAQVNFGDERFNYAGSILMIEAVFKALGGNADLLPALRKVWDNQPSYTFRYEQRITFGVTLLSDDLKALQEVSAKYHKLENAKILDLGIHELLHGKKSVNEKRLAIYRRAGQSVDMGPELRVAPASEAQRQAIEAYTKNAGIDVTTFYHRAFLVGLQVLRKEDPLGRGSF